MFHSVGSRQIHSLSFGKGPGTLVGVAGAFANWEIFWCASEEPGAIEIVLVADVPLP